jgi:hypothetical protein
VAVTGVARGALAEAENDEAVARISKLNKKAVNEYDNLNFEEARKILKEALDLCRQHGLDKHPVAARTYVNLGVVTLTGLKQRDAAVKLFRKALEIQPDVKLSKSLANPEIQEAFDEAASASTPKTSAPPPAATGTSNAALLTHEPVTRASQGRTVPIALTVEASLSADKVTLFYRPGGEVDFLEQPMTEATPGNYAAEIPVSATAGGTVEYYLQADKGGQPAASVGSKASPLVVALAPSAAVAAPRPRREKIPTTDREAAHSSASRLYFGVRIGSGLGWTSGTGEVNSVHRVSPAGFAPAQLGHVAPELGYFVRPGLLLSLQGRIQLVTGVTSDPACASGCSSPPTTALAAFAKVTWLFGEGEKLRPYFSLAAGGGTIRHVTDFPSFPAECGAAKNATCVESVRAGAVLLGPGAGIDYALSPRFGLLAGVDSQVGFPKFTFNLDLDLGVALRF